MSKYQNRSSNLSEQRSAGAEGTLPARDPFTVQIRPGIIVAREEFEAQRSDRGARGELVVTLADELLTSHFIWTLRRLNGDRSEDLLRTDCLVAIDRLIRSFDPARDPALDRYVGSFLRKRVIDLWREEGQKQTIELLSAPDDLAAEFVPDTNETETMLASLSPRQRHIARIRMLGAQYRDVARELDISESALYAELRVIRSRGEPADRIETTRSDFERFITHLLRPETAPQKIQLSDYARSPDFFARYLHEMREVFRFKRIVRASHEQGHDLLGGAAHHLARYIVERHGGIDCIPRAALGPIARLLGTPKSASAILLNLHARGACSLSPPENQRWHDLTRLRHRPSPYFDATVVGKARALANIHAHTQKILPDLTALEDRTLVRHLGSLLRLPPNRGAIGAYCVRAKIVSPILPVSILPPVSATSPFAKARPYFDRSVVGESAAATNLRLAVQRTFASLDAVTRDRNLVQVLRCRDSVTDIVRHLAATTLLGSIPPLGTSLIRPDGHLTRYADERILGAGARPVFEELFRATYKTVDDLPWRSSALAGAFDCSDNLRSIAQAAIKRGLLPETIPAGDPWYRVGGAPSRYFSPSIVGAERALRSLHRAIESLVPKLDNILDIEEAARILAVSPTERAVARRCITLGLTDGRANPDTPILRSNGELSLHLDPRVRRRSLAIDDLRMIVTAQQLSIEDLTRIPQLAPLLRCEPSRSGIISGLAQNAVRPFAGAVPAKLDFNRQLHPAFNRAATPPVRWHANMKTYLALHYASLDELHRDRLLAEALGCPNTVRDIARSVVAERLMPWRAPVGFSLFGVPGGSLYVDEEIIVDPRRVDLNIRRSLRGKITTLDDVFQNEALASALRCPKNATAIAAALAERRILSAELPPHHPFTIGRERSRYFEAAVVGHTQVTRNIKTFLHRAAPTLDDIPMIDALCNTLQVERRRHALAAHVVHFGLLDWRIPPGHEVARAGGSLYLNRAVLGGEKVTANILAHLIDRYGGNLDALPRRSKSLASALGVENTKEAIVRAILAREILPNLPPAGYDPATTEKSVYLNPAIVGHFTAACNRATSAAQKERGQLRS